MSCNLKDYYTTFDNIDFQEISTNPLGIISFYFNKLNFNRDYIDGQVILIPKEEKSGIGKKIEYLASVSLLANLDNNTHLFRTYITSYVSLSEGTLLNQQEIFQQIYINSVPLKSYAIQTLLNDSICKNIEPSSKINTQYKNDLFYVYLYANFKPIL